MTGSFGSDHRLYVDWGKLVTILTIISATVGLAVAGVIGADAAMLILGSAAGYTFGNGRQAVAGRPPAPMIGSVRTSGTRAGDTPAVVPPDIDA